MPENMMRQVPKPVIRDPELNALMRSKKEALNAYVVNSEKYGEDDARTKSKLVLYVLRSKLCVVKETIAGYKDVMVDFAAISGEIDGLLDMDFNVSAQQFSHGIEGFPRFLRKFIVRRRAKRYYKKKMARLESMIDSTIIGLGAVGEFMSIVLNSMMGLSKVSSNLLTGGKKKSKKNFLDDDMRAEIESAKMARQGHAEQLVDIGSGSSESSSTAGSNSDSGNGSGVMNW